MRRDLGRRDPFRPTVPERLMVIPGGMWQPRTDRRTRLVCSSGSSRGLTNLTLRFCFFFQLMQGVEEQNEDYCYYYYYYYLFHYRKYLF